MLAKSNTNTIFTKTYITLKNLDQMTLDTSLGVLTNICSAGPLHASSDAGQEYG